MNRHFACHHNHDFESASSKGHDGGVTCPFCGSKTHRFQLPIPEKVGNQAPTMDFEEVSRDYSVSALAELGGHAGLRAKRTTSPRMSVELVGRQSQLNSIQSAFDVVSHGVAMSVFISGNSGMGKSVLVQIFLKRLRK